MNKMVKSISITCRLTTMTTSNLEPSQLRRSLSHFVVKIDHVISCLALQE